MDVRGDWLIHVQQLVFCLMWQTGEHSAYHHGEASLSGTIVSMAQAGQAKRLELTDQNEVFEVCRTSWGPTTSTC